MYENRKGCSLRNVLIAAGLGLGLAVGGGIVYAVANSETARLVLMGTGMFLLGGIIVGLAVILANRSLAQSLSSRIEKTSYHYPAPYPSAPRVEQAPYRPFWWGVLPPMLTGPSPGRQWQWEEGGFGDFAQQRHVVDASHSEEDEIVA